MQIVVIDKLNCNGLSFNKSYQLFTNSYFIRIDKKRLLKMFPPKSTNYDIFLKEAFQLMLYRFLVD